VKLQLKKRRLIPVALAILVLVVGSGVAYAFWTSGGSGSGGANAAAGVETLTVNQDALTPMFPGDVVQTISGTFNNPNAASTYVTTVTASIFSVTKAVGAPAGDCDATDFVLAPTTASVAALIPSGNSQGIWSGPKIQFNNKVTNQDGCKGAAVILHYVIS
jgi:hypothetical protein